MHKHSSQSGFAGLPARVNGLAGVAAVNGLAPPGPFFRSARARLFLCLLLNAVALSAWAEAGAALPVAREWRFQVFLDDREIGYHHFFLEEEGETRRLRSVADFEYTLMLVKLYEYQHQNEEVWHGDCLARIESSTDANGKPYAVSGELQSDAFVVQGSKGEATLPSCIMSFAYWNPEFLKQRSLLNTQNGEYLDVQVSPAVPEELEIQGRKRPAFRYELASGPMRIQLWYSADREWLGLESSARGGRTLRYVLL